MAENVDRMVWMGAGRPPGPGSWEASEVARETNSPLLLNCLSVLYPPAITNSYSNSYKYYQSNCSDPRTTTSWNLRPENSGSCPSSIPAGVWLLGNGRGRASHLLRKLAHSVSSSANCHVTRVQLTVGGGSTVWWECSRGACACPQESPWGESQG